MRKILLFVAILFASFTWGTQVFLKPNSNWLQKDGDGVDPRFAVYCYGTSGEKWVSMTEVTGYSSKFFQADIPSGYDKCIFCRMNGANSVNDWSNKYNQTGNLTVPTGDAIYYSVPNGEYDWDAGTDDDWSEKPFEVSVGGTWLRFTGETIILNATCAGATNFQWYKGGTDESNIIPGAINATYTKTNCTFEDGGHYYCKAWRDVDHKEVNSSPYDVRVPYLNIKTGRHGSDADLQRIALTRADKAAEIASGSLLLGLGWDYGFFISDGIDNHGQNNGDYYLDDKLNSNNCTDWDRWVMNDSYNRCVMRTTKQGTYTFTIKFSKDSWTPIKVNVEYPPMVQTAGRPIYIEKTPELVAYGWNKFYYRIGKGNQSDGDDENWTSAYEMTLVPGTERYYQSVTPGWGNDFWAWHIANNTGDANSVNDIPNSDPKSSIYKTNSGATSKEITRSINFSGDEIRDPGWTIYPTVPAGDVNNWGKDGKNNNCRFLSYTQSDGMITHNASIGATTHGELRINWTDVNNVSQESLEASARAINDLAHTCILTITAVPDCGYKIKTLQVNGVDFTSGSTHILDADATIEATFEIASYTVTLHTNGGTINSGDVTGYTFGIGATLPTDISYTGKDFTGWYENSGCTGSPVTTITTTDCGDKEYWAGWTTCPATNSGKVVYRFVVKSSMTSGNVCAAANTDYPMTTSNSLSGLTGGTLTARASSTNRLSYASGAFTFKNGEGGVLRVDLDCPIASGDFIRFINSATNSNYNAYVRHTSSSTSADQITLTEKNPTITSIAIPDAFIGETTLYIVRGANNGALISYFEIVRSCAVLLDANGGKVGGEDTKTVRGALGDEVALPHAFKDGEKFKGWYDAPSGGTAVSNPYTIAGPTTLYAQYEDCPDEGTLYKFEVRTGLTNGSVTANDVDFEFTTANYLTTLIGGTLTTGGSKASKVTIIGNNALNVTDNAAYLKIDLDCEIQEGDVFKTTINENTLYINNSTSRTTNNKLEIGTLIQTPIPEALIGKKTLYLWKGDGDKNAISYFEIVRPKQTVITLDATGAYNKYTRSVVAIYEWAMPKIQVRPQRTGYIFAGYYDEPNGAGTQYYDSRGNSMHDWNKDVKTATLYAYWVVPCDMVPDLESIAPEVTIWNNQEVDMALVRLICDYDTTGIQYSLLSASEAIPGCTFSYFDERIYIQGTPELGNTTTVTKTITFTMANNCSPARTYTVDATIRIYPAGQKAKIAYIITGTEGGAFTAFSTANESASADLLTYLRTFYTVGCVNGYATKDPAAIANFYKDYDLLIVTDFLDTDKGYTNAIGTLIDKKPILSFEAFVAGNNGSNWHIGSNPVSPKKKVRDMEVLCAGHTIFKDAGLSDTDDTIRVLTHISPYIVKKDDEYVDVSEGLQGFEINTAPDFIFLATIRDTTNNRDLIVCCERQVVFPARLLMYCINYTQMGNLTPNGKLAMKQMIDYLLMTDETKVADCSLVFDNGKGDSTPFDEAAYHAAGGTGTRGDNLWSTAANWAPGYNITPTPFIGARIIAECHVDVDSAHAGNVRINKGKDKDGNPVNGKLIIKPNGGLTIAAVVQQVNDTRYASPITIKAEDLFIESNETGNGALVYGNKESDVRATVQYYSRGENAKTPNPVWQYIGIPFQPSKTAIQMYYAAWMCRWSTASDKTMGGLWQWVENEDVLLPFEGYCITQEAKKTYEFAGKLNPPITTTLALDNRDEEGYAFAANSWTAPIKIAKMEDTDFINAEKSIYIYHTGSFADYTDHGGATAINAKTEGAALQTGQYAVVPIHAAPYLAKADSVIPSMQGFFVKVKEVLQEASLKLVYNRTVYDATNFTTSTQPMRAPRNVSRPEVMVVYLVGENYGDRVHILASDGFSENFEDGWDGRKIDGDEAAPKLAVVKEEGEMAVAAVGELEGRELSFRAGEDTEYTFHFNYEGETIYLYDRLADQAVEIKTGNTYSFTAENKTPAKRFIITKNPPRIPTDIENTTSGSQYSDAEKCIIDGQLYIIKNNRFYDARGVRVNSFKRKEVTP